MLAYTTFKPDKRESKKRKKNTTSFLVINEFVRFAVGLNCVFIRWVIFFFWGGGQALICYSVMFHLHQ